SVVLTTLLTGIALGSLLARRMLAHVTDPLRLLGVLQYVIGLSTLLLLPLQWQLNGVRAGVLDLLGELGWWQLTATKFVVAAVSLLVPTLAMGASFPCAVQAGAQARRPHGRLVGNLYAVNAFCG